MEEIDVMALFREEPDTEKLIAQFQDRAQELEDEAAPLCQQAGAFRALANSLRWLSEQAET